MAMWSPLYIIHSTSSWTDISHLLHICIINTPSNIMICKLLKQNWFVGGRKARLRQILTNLDTRIIKCKDFWRGLYYVISYLILYKWWIFFFCNFYYTREPLCTFRCQPNLVCGLVFLPYHLSFPLNYQAQNKYFIEKYCNVVKKKVTVDFL